MIAAAHERATVPVSVPAVRPVWSSGSLVITFGPSSPSSVPESGVSLVHAAADDRGAGWRRCLRGAPRQRARAVGQLAERGLLDRRVGGGRADRVDTPRSAGHGCEPGVRDLDLVVRVRLESRSRRPAPLARTTPEASFGRTPGGVGVADAAADHALAVRAGGDVGAGLALGDRERGGDDRRVRVRSRGYGRGGAAARRPSSPSPPVRRVRPARWQRRPSAAGRAADGRSLPHPVDAGAAVERVRPGPPSSRSSSWTRRRDGRRRCLRSGGRGRCHRRSHLRRSRRRAGRCRRRR